MQFFSLYLHVKQTFNVMLLEMSRESHKYFRNEVNFKNVSMLLSGVNEPVENKVTTKTVNKRELQWN